MGRTATRAATGTACRESCGFSMSKTIARRFVSMQDAANVGCNERTLRNHIASGDITGYRIGRVCRLDLDELVEWMTPDNPTVKAG